MKTSIRNAMKKSAENLSKFAMHLSHVSSSSHSTEITFFLNQQSESGMIIVEFTKLLCKQRLIARSVLENSWDKKTFGNAQKWLNDFFLACASSVNESCEHYRFQDLDEILSAVRDSDAFWKIMRDFAEDSSVGFCALQESITACGDYRRMCDDLDGLVADLYHKVSSLTFLDESQTNSPNECEKYEFYSDLAILYERVHGVTYIQKHMAFDARDIREKAQQSIRSATNEIGQILLELINTFPTVLRDFKKIHLWRSNLSCISQVFQDIAPGIALRDCKRMESERSF